MDSIFAIVALVVFYALQALASKKRKSMPPQDSEVPGEEINVEMQDALAEIRHALGMGDPAPAASPPDAVETSAPAAAEPGDARRTAAPRRATAPTRIADATATTSRPQTSDEFHRVVTGRPDAESTFESRREEWNAREKAKTNWPTRRVLTDATPTEDTFESGASTFRDPLRDHDHIPPLKAVSIAAKPRRRRRLGTPEEIREAFITAEILGPPKALQSRR
jgi:hypothetical protein